MIVIGFDSALSSFGFAVAGWDGWNLVFQEVGCWTTKASPTRESKGADITERWMQHYRRARELVHRWRPHMLCVEAVAFPRGAVRWSTVSALGRARAIVDALAVERRCIVRECTPVALKKAVTGRATASKDEVQAALRRSSPSFARALDSVPEGLREHAADAAATVVAMRGWLQRMGATWE